MMAIRCGECKKIDAVVYDTIGQAKFYYCGYCYIDKESRKNSRRIHRSGIQAVKPDKIVSL
tara:strand:+ start:1779 stop:1961 length:183 start_codon:yes stop_codon:yes gene_type:complete